MPTFKHPCPHCGKFIERDVAACPYCATRDPFAPARCPNCRTVIEDPSWLACPRCGQPVGASSGITRVVNVLTLGGREKTRHPDVNTHDRTAARQFALRVPAVEIDTECRQILTDVRQHCR